MVFLSVNHSQLSKMGRIESSAFLTCRFNLFLTNLLSGFAFMLTNVYEGVVFFK